SRLFGEAKAEWIKVRKYTDAPRRLGIRLASYRRPLGSAGMAGVTFAFASQRLARPISQLQSSRPLFLIGIKRISSGRDNVSNIKLTVNGKAVSVEAEDRTLLVHLLRDHLNLTGTHVGCDTSQCGACVVHVDGRAVKSCTMLAGQAAGSSVTTIEGIAKGDE